MGIFFVLLLIRYVYYISSNSLKQWRPPTRCLYNSKS